MNIRIGLAVAGFATAAVGLALAAETTAPVDTAPLDVAQQADHGDAAMIAKGKMLYAHHCSHCHGFNMVTAGSIAPDLRKFPRDDRLRFFLAVTSGKNNRMPPWGDLLSGDDIEDLWALVSNGGKP